MTVKPTYEELEKRVRQLEKIKSERKQAEEVLKESETKYRALYENSLEAILLTAQDGSIYSANQVACEILEKSESEIISGGRDRIVNLDDPRLPAALEERYKKGKFNGELTFKKKDGTIFPVELSSSTFQDCIGNEKACIFFRDISERKRAEEALRNSEEKHRRLFETMAQGVTYQAADGTIISANPAAERILGLSFEQMQGKTSMDPQWKMILEDGTTVPGTEHPAMIALHTGKTVGPVVRGVFHPDKNTYVWLSITAIPLFQPGETKPFQVYATFEDITVLKEAQDNLQKSHDRIQAIYDALDDAIILVDPITRKVIECNNATAEIFGYSSEEILGKDTRSLHIDQEHFEKFGSKAIAAYADPGYYVTEFEMRRKDGSVFPTENFVRPVLDSNGQIVYVVSVVRDITDRKRLHAQLSQLQKAESLGRMAGAIAHHFNNQLSVVMGNLELVLDDLPDDVENRENLFQAFEAGHKAAEVSQQMLRYLGHISGSQTTIDLSDVCRQSLALLQSALPSGLTLNFDFPDSGPFVHADAGQIQQVLTNLFTNAQESFPDNKGIIGLVIQTVSYEEIPTSKRFPLDWQPRDITYACLEISDTGCGISKEDVVKIFDPFYTTKFTGRGMGLPVTMGILKTHGGCITVDNEPDSGCIFRVYLPVSTERKPAKHEKATIPKGKGGNGGTVLLIEDEESVRNTAKVMISRLGYKVIEAQDGVEAVRLFQEHQNEIDCVLSDLTMPRMNGWDTLTALREKGADVPVILASGYDKDTVMAGDHPELPQAFLNKPYSMAALKDVLMEVIRL